MEFLSPVSHRGTDNISYVLQRVMNYGYSRKKYLGGGGGRRQAIYFSMGGWCGKFSNYMGQWCPTKSNYMSGWFFDAWKGKRE